MTSSDRTCYPEALQERAPPATLAEAAAEIARLKAHIRCMNGAIWMLLPRRAFGRNCGGRPLKFPPGVSAELAQMVDQGTDRADAKRRLLVKYRGGVRGLNEALKRDAHRTVRREKTRR